MAKHRSHKGLQAATSATTAHGRGEVRIIAGRYRGRRLPVAPVQGLRPTGDRVRETLFNWLQHEIAGARCLDAFAGTGALGFEAASRYAGSVTLVEPNANAANELQRSRELLAAESVEVRQQSFQQFAESVPQLETPKSMPDEEVGIPTHWVIRRDKSFGEVRARLCDVNSVIKG